MINRILVTAAIVAATGSAVPAQEQNYSGLASCWANKQIYVVGKSDGGFQIVAQTHMSNYEVLSYETTLAPGSYEYRRSDIEITEVNDDRLVLRGLYERDCGETEVILARRPGMLVAYTELQKFAETAELSGENAALISDGHANLAPSGMLPALDRQILPEATSAAVNDFFSRYLEQLEQKFAEMPVTTQVEADALAAAVGEGYPANLGFQKSLFADNTLVKHYNAQISEAGMRIAFAGFDVKPMTQLSNEEFCRAITSNEMVRADRMEPVFGLPFAHWDRNFTESAIARTEACDRPWATERAEQIAAHFPAILAAGDMLQAQIDERRAEQELMQGLQRDIARLESLPNTWETYQETRGYESFKTTELPQTASRELRAEHDRLHHLAWQRQQAAEPVVRAYFDGKFFFDEAAYTADDWQEHASLNDPRCVLPEFEGTDDRIIANSMSAACRQAIEVANIDRTSALCARTLEATGLSQEELNVTLLMSAEGPPAFNMGNRPLHEILCSYGQKTELQWRDTSGIFTTSYELTATYRDNASWVTNTVFKKDKEQDGLTPVEINHSVGGDLFKSESLNSDPQARMICVVNPQKRYCRGE